MAELGFYSFYLLIYKNIETGSLYLSIKI